MKQEHVSFKTSDNVTIHANYINAGANAPCVVLLHMLPETKESWDTLAKRLGESNISSLAIDLRGHGQSTHINGQILGYEQFEETDHQQSIIDIEASLKWLEAKGVPRKKIAIIGASIGANLALQALSFYQDILTVVALSPGLNYHGIETENFITSFKITQSVLFVVSEDDAYSYSSVIKLYETTNIEKDLVVYKNAGHGTYIFDAQPELYGKIIEWLNNKL